jgi:oligosaccharide repeat unit polymerase
LKYPWWTAGSGTLMLLGFSIILASKPPKNRFFIYALLFMIIKTVALLKGGRGNFVISLMFLIWYYYRFYSVNDISIRKIIPISIFIIFMAQYMVVARSGGEFDFKDINEIFILFFAQQGVSMLVPGYMIYYKDTFVREGTPYILAPITSLGSYSPSQSVETVKNYNMLGHDLSYFLNPKLYLHGEGIAGCFLGELYDLPLVVMVILLFLLGYFIIHYHNSVKYNKLYLMLSFPIIYQIFKMPRGNFFPNINIWLLLIVVFLIMKIISTKKVRHV